MALSIDVEAVNVARLIHDACDSVREMVWGVSARPSGRATRAFWGACAAVMALYAVHALRVEHAYNDWSWIEIGPTLRTETLRLVSQSMLASLYRLLGPVAWVPAAINFALNLSVVPVLARTLPALGLSRRAAAIAALASVLAPGSTEAFSFLAQSETVVGRSLVVAFVALAMRRHRAAFVMLALAAVAHETSLVAIPLTVLALLALGRHQVRLWLASRHGGGLTALWLLIVVLRIALYEHQETPGGTHAVSVMSVLPNLGMLVLGVGRLALHAWLPAAALLVRAPSPSHDETSASGTPNELSPHRFWMLISLATLVAYTPYLPMAGYHSEYFYTLASVPLSIVTGIAIDRALHRADGWRRWWSAAAGALLALSLGVPLFEASAGRPERAITAGALAAARRSRSLGASAFPRCFWITGEPAAARRAAAILDAELGRSSMLALRVSDVQFVVLTGSVDRREARRGDIVLSVGDVFESTPEWEVVTAPERLAQESRRCEIERVSGPEGDRSHVGRDEVMGQGRR